jgi:hypothetical protein
MEPRENMTMRPRDFLAPLVLSLVASGCSIDRMAADGMVPVLRRTEASFEASRTVRAGREGGPGLLFTLDGLVATSPENPDLLELAAQMNATFAFGFLEEEDPAWANELYEKAQGYAKRALVVRDSDLAHAVDAKVSEKPKLEDVSKDAVPALFWFTFAWGSRINLNRSDERLVGELGQVDRGMQAVIERDEAFFNGGAHLYFAIRYASLSKNMGGDPDKAKSHFDAVDRITGNRHLMARFLRAKFWSSSLANTKSDASIEVMTVAQKAAWDDFLATLKAVVEAKDDLWPEQRLVNELAKSKARKLLAKPSEANIIVPQGVENPFAKKKDED